MAEQGKEAGTRNVPDSLRTAIERTFAATAEGAAETRGRAEAALDEVSRRGREARKSVAGRAQDARDSSSGAANRVIEAIEGMRLATREELRDLSKQVETLSKRVEELEAKAKAEG